MASVRVRKRGHKFSYAFEAGQTPEGKRKIVEKGGFLTRDLAYDAGVDAYNAFKHGNLAVTSSRVQVVDYMRMWLETIYINNVSKGSYDSSYQIFTKRIFPAFHGKTLQDLKPVEYAVYPAELISSNPCTYVKVPKRAPEDITPKVVIEPDTFKALMEK